MALLQGRQFPGASLIMSGIGDTASDICQRGLAVHLDINLCWPPSTMLMLMSLLCGKKRTTAVSWYSQCHQNTRRTVLCRCTAAFSLHEGGDYLSRSISSIHAASDAGSPLEL